MFIIRVLVCVVQFADKLESVATALQLAADRAQRAEPVSAHPDKLKEQMVDTALTLDDVQKMMAQLEFLRTSAQDLTRQSSLDSDGVKSMFTFWLPLCLVRLHVLTGLERVQAKKYCFVAQHWLLNLTM